MPGSEYEVCELEGGDADEFDGEFGIKIAVGVAVEDSFGVVIAELAGLGEWVGFAEQRA